ncbi:hypothetical protein F5884DRAFT_859896 [Xylogone sp. PMI_703]|nr:hypothetical protein F5884DRAFT_859896 [Xylogone sp. PMI_703]
MSPTLSLKEDSPEIQDGISPEVHRGIQDGIELNTIQQSMPTSQPVNSERTTDRDTGRADHSHHPSIPPEPAAVSVSIIPPVQTRSVAESSLPPRESTLQNRPPIPVGRPADSVPPTHSTSEISAQVLPEGIIPIKDFPPSASSQPIPSPSSNLRGESSKPSPPAGDIPLPKAPPRPVVNNITQTTSSHQSPFVSRERRRSTDSDTNVRRSVYHNSITEAARIFDHLANARVLADVPHRNININYIDYTASSTSGMVRVNDQDDISSLIQNVPAGVTQRLFVVEDLDWATIDCFGTCLGINPEFFEEHLLNSGYGRAQYDDASANSWMTSGMKKSYTSLKWYRPAWRMPMPPFSKQDLEDLLDVDIGLGRLEYTSGKSGHVRVYETKVNIFRSEWELWTDPRTTPRMRRLCGWEERASVWSKTYPERNYKIVILLLDPLPVLSKSIERVVQISATSSESSTNEEELYRLHLPESFTDSDMSTVDIEEQITRRVERHSRRSRREAFRRLVRRYLYGENKTSKGSTEKKLELIESKSIIEQTTSRVPVHTDLDATFQSPELLQQLRSRLFNTQATVDNFRMYIEQHNLIEGNSGHFGVLKPLFEIVRRDIIEFLRRLNDVLEGINLEILDDITMEDRLAIWRKLITRAQLELPELQQSLVNFFSSLGDQGTVTRENDQVNGASNDFKDLSEQIDNMLRRLNIVSSSLTSNMALLDSRRSIAEAQSVTKLTELAFFYIPLTFAATLFGMQIEQFENRAPLSIFIGLGVLFTALSYSVRLILRSTWLRLMTHRMKESIKLYADRNRQHIQKGSISSSLFLKWMSHVTLQWFVKSSSTLLRVTGASLRLLLAILSFLLDPFKFIMYIILSISIICIIPLALLWSRHMEPGIQVPVTLALLATSSALAITVCWRLVNPEVRSTLPRLITREFASVNTNNSRLFSFLKWIVPIGAFVVPLAVLWTKPTSAGVRAAITTAFVLIVVLSLISYGIYKLVSLAQGYNVEELEDSDESTWSSSSGSSE